MTRVLVLAPHHDDEVLGVGGTIARHVHRGDEVHVVIATRGTAPMFPAELVEQVRSEATRAHERLGVAGSHYLDLPAARLDTLPLAEVNQAVGRCFADLRPEVAYLPFPGDLHRDHQLVFDAAMVAVRPGPHAPAEVLTYETLSETNWNAPHVTPPFVPVVWVDIGEHLDTKLEAMAAYASQLRDFPDERSLRAIRALAEHRGATVGLAAAEAFGAVRLVRR